jgi:hypothetical protein
VLMEEGFRLYRERLVGLTPAEGRGLQPGVHA